MSLTCTLNPSDGDAASSGWASAVAGPEKPTLKVVVVLILSMTASCSTAYKASRATATTVPMTKTLPRMRVANSRRAIR